MQIIGNTSDLADIEIGHLISIIVGIAAALFGGGFAAGKYIERSKNSLTKLEERQEKFERQYNLISKILLDLDPNKSFEDNILSNPKIIQRLRENKILCALGYYSFTALIDIKPDPGAVYIHSASEPYNEEQIIEQIIDQKRIDNWLEHFGMKKFQSHCSGHARRKDLLAAVKEIGAKRLFPIHTEHPEIYKKITSNLELIKEGKTYVIKN